MMMKKKFILLSTLVNFTFVFSQVGINTENPQGIFNIDGGKDNPATGSAHTATQQINDFTVLANGNVGIGTISPSQKLEIQTGGTPTIPVIGFKLADGNQASGYVLTTDASGVATWKPISTTLVAGGFITNSNNLAFAPTGGWTQTGGFITLTPGMWKVDLIELIKGKEGIDWDNITSLAADDYAWIRFTLADSNSTTSPSSDFIKIDANGIVSSEGEQLVATGFSGTKKAGGGNNDMYSVAQGSFLIRNSGTTAKTYYVLSQVYKASNTYTTNQFFFEGVGSSQWGENRITATAINP